MITSIGTTAEVLILISFFFFFSEKGVWWGVGVGGDSQVTRPYSGKRVGFVYRSQAGRPVGRNKG